MNEYKTGIDLCDSCTRRRCKLKPKNGKCPKYVPAKSGWTLKEVYHEKLSQA